MFQKEKDEGSRMEKVVSWVASPGGVRCLSRMWWLSSGKG